MSCIVKIDRYLIPNESIVTLSKIYSYIGKNQYYKKDLQANLSKIVDDTIERDTYFLSQLIGLNVSDNRTRLIINKTSNPRTIEEGILAKIKEKLDHMQFFASDYKIDSEGILGLISEIYKPKVIKFKNSLSYMLLDDWAKKVSRLREEEAIEKLYVDIHYLIDVYNLSPLEEHNDLLILLFLYLILLRCDCECFKYISLFEIISESYAGFKEKLGDTTFGWDDNHSQTKEVVDCIFNVILEGYAKCERIIKSYGEEMDSNKFEAILKTIEALPRTFTKDDIRAIHPFTSESTINRVLTYLRDDKQIKPTGNGRSAKWMKTGMF